jgi:hypothetical protein
VNAHPPDPTERNLRATCGSLFTFLARAEHGDGGVPDDLGDVAAILDDRGDQFTQAAEQDDRELAWR